MCIPVPLRVLHSIRYAEGTYGRTATKYAEQTTQKLDPVKLVARRRGERFEGANIRHRAARKEATRGGNEQAQR